MATVEVIKDKLKRWRAFTKTTMGGNPPSRITNDLKTH